MKTQNEMILSDLKKGIIIDPMYALKKYGCFRLAARIDELRAHWNIKTIMVNSNGKRYGKYKLIRKLPSDSRRAA
jgi:hypothetical protein